MTDTAEQMTVNVSAAGNTLKHYDGGCQISICDQEQAFHRTTRWLSAVIDVEVPLWSWSYKLESTLMGPVLISMLPVYDQTRLVLSSCVAYFHLKRQTCVRVVKGRFFLTPVARLSSATAKKQHEKIHISKRFSLVNLIQPSWLLWNVPFLLNYGLAETSSLMSELPHRAVVMIWIVHR